MTTSKPSYSESEDSTMRSPSSSNSGSFNADRFSNVLGGSPMSWRPDSFSARFTGDTPMSWKPDPFPARSSEGSPMSWQAISPSAHLPRGSTSGEEVRSSNNQRPQHWNIASADHTSRRASTIDVLELARRQLSRDSTNSSSSLRAPFKTFEPFRCPNTNCNESFKSADRLKDHMSYCEIQLSLQEVRSNTTFTLAHFNSHSPIRLTSEGMPSVDGLDNIRFEKLIKPGHEALQRVAEKESISVHLSQLQVKCTDVKLEHLQGVIKVLINIFDNLSMYKKLLSLRNSEAQLLLDVFQVLLDSNNSNAGFRRNLLVATQRLSKSASVYPASYNLENIDLESVHPVAAGGFADIYKGSLSGMDVCLKAIRLYQTSDIDSFFKQFSAEAVLWSQLSHPNLLPFYGLCRYNGRPCLVSPWMEYGDINKYLLQCPRADRNLLVAPRFVRSVLVLTSLKVLDIVSGVAYLHDNDIIHGDLKGANILVHSSGRACLADFGLSAVSDVGILHWTSHSSAASKGGSVRWQAPELFDEERDETVHNSKASDVYAVMCVAYEVFTSNLPFYEHSRDTAVMVRVKEGAKPTRPSVSSSAWTSFGLTTETWSIMEVAWRRNPASRPLIHEIVDHFKAQPPVDNRPMLNSRSISSMRFRDSLEKLPPASDIESLLNGVH